MDWIPVGQITPNKIGPRCDVVGLQHLSKLLSLVAAVCPDAVGAARKNGEWIFELRGGHAGQRKNLLTIWPSISSVRVEFYPEQREPFDESRVSDYRTRLLRVRDMVLWGTGARPFVDSTPVVAPSREFRSAASYAAEDKTRAMVVPFLTSRGFTKLQEQTSLHGKVRSQVVTGIAPSGEPVKLRIRLCWRKERNDRARGYSAAQIIPKVEPGEWIEAFARLVERHAKEGVTHLLLIRREEEEITLAASIPIHHLPSVWQAQRDESARLITAGLMGQRRKNHAENGSSPTLWLEDEKAPSVPMALWQHEGVTDLAQLPVVDAAMSSSGDIAADIEAIAAASSATERAELIKCRLGQGKFRRELLKLRGKCYVTGITDPRLLRASHIKPWCDSTNTERLDPHNGLLLTPLYDHLFDQGLISFTDDGEMLVAPSLPETTRAALNIKTKFKGSDLGAKTRTYLADHRAKFQHHQDSQAHVHA